MNKKSILIISLLFMNVFLLKSDELVEVKNFNNIVHYLKEIYGPTKMYKTMLSTILISDKKLNKEYGWVEGNTSLIDTPEELSNLLFSSLVSENINIKITDSELSDLVNSINKSLDKKIILKYICSMWKKKEIEINYYDISVFQKKSLLQNYEKVMKTIIENNNLLKEDIDQYYSVVITEEVNDLVDEIYNTVQIQLGDKPFVDSNKSRTLVHIRMDATIIDNDKYKIILYYDGEKKNKFISDDLNVLKKYEIEDNYIINAKKELNYIPAIIFSKWTINPLPLIKKTIINFYLNPEQNNYELLKKINILYSLKCKEINDKMKNNEEKYYQELKFYIICSGHFYWVLSSLDYDFFNKLLNEGMKPIDKTKKIDLSEEYKRTLIQDYP